MITVTETFRAQLFVNHYWALLINMYTTSALLSEFGVLYSLILEIQQQIQLHHNLLDSIMNSTELFLNKIQSTRKNLVLKIHNTYIIDKFIYAIVALYDKITLQTALQKSSDHAIIHNMWDSVSLEVKIFRTAQAGQKLFQDLVEIQEYKEFELRQSMLKVYYNIILTGFSKISLKDDVEEYKKRILEMLYDRKDLFEAKAITMQNKQEKVDYSNWFALFGLTLYILASSSIWLHTTRPINNKIDLILQELR